MALYLSLSETRDISYVRLQSKDLPEWVSLPGGHSPEKVEWICPAVKTPFSYLSRYYLDLQLQHDSVLWTPILSREICQKFEEFSALQPKLGSNFTS